MITNFLLKTKRFLAYVVHQTAEEPSINTMYISDLYYFLIFHVLPHSHIQKNQQ